MDELVSQVVKLRESWNATYAAVQANPAAVAPYLNGVTVEQIDEVVKTTKNLLVRAKAPKGFHPSFHMAKALAITALPYTLAAATNLQAGQYAHFPAFLAGLNQILSAAHSLITFSDNREVVAGLSAELAENISLLDTAQTELKRKSDNLESATQIAEKIESSVSLIEGYEVDSKKLIDAIEKTLEVAKEKTAEVEVIKVQQNEMQKQISAVLAKAAAIQEELNEKKEELAEITGKAVKQEEIIAGLLPKGASAGLAYSFHGRVVSMEKTKLVWLIIFLLSIAGLVLTGYWITILTAKDPNLVIWQATIHKLPLLIPLVWLGWFSAIQYGNSLRVQEDYAFKEATSNAFQGYRDHMEHLQSIESSDAKSALDLLAIRTIEILAAEPLRVFQKNERDASPSHFFKDLITNKTERPKPEA